MMLLRLLRWLVFTSATSISLIGLNQAALASTQALDCAALTGQWQGVYMDQGDLYTKPTGWPIIFNLKYDDKNHLVSGIASTPLVPSTVTPDGKMTYISDQPAQLVGWCEDSKITKLLLYVDKPKCGHYAEPGGGFLNETTLLLHLTYEFAMIDANFIALVHKITDPADIKPMDQPAAVSSLPPIDTCH